jgi:hypothetical protein
MRGRRAVPWLSAVLIGLAIGTLAAARGSSLWSDSPPSSASGGREVFSHAGESGSLRIVSVRASAFSTLIEARLTMDTDVGPDDTVAIDKEALSASPGEQAAMAGVRRISPDEFALLVSLGPLPAGSNELSLKLDAYVIVRPDRAERVDGPFIATAKLTASAPGIKARSSGPPQAFELGSDIRFIVEDYSYDGYILRLGYRFEGPIDGVVMFPARPDTPGVVLNLLGPVPAERAVIDVRIEAGPGSLELVVPRLVRHVSSAFTVRLSTNPAGGLLGTSMAGSSQVEFEARASDGSTFGITITPAAGSNLGFTDSVRDVHLVDDNGRTYPLMRVSGTAAGEPQSGSVLWFEGDPGGAGELRLSFRGYEEALTQPKPIGIKLD